MNKEELRAAIDTFFQDRLKLHKKGKYWYNDNGFAKLLFYLEPARFMDCFYINVGIYYNNLDGVSSKSLPNFHDWHFNADIGYIYRNTPILVSYDINEEELNAIFEIIKNVVIPFADNYRNKDFLKTHPDIWDSPWQKRLSKERLFGFADSL